MPPVNSRGARRAELIVTAAGVLLVVLVAVGLVVFGAVVSGGWGL